MARPNKKNPNKISRCANHDPFRKTVAKNLQISPCERFSLVLWIARQPVWKRWIHKAFKKSPEMTGVGDPKLLLTRNQSTWIHEMFIGLFWMTRLVPLENTKGAGMYSTLIEKRILNCSTFLSSVHELPFHSLSALLPSLVGAKTDLEVSANAQAKQLSA